jgi:hypothetical protein
MAVVLLLVIPDYRTLASLAYVLILKWSVFNWSIVNQWLCVLAGLLWSAVAIVLLRRSSRCCEHCGRSEQKLCQWTTPEKARKWGRWATLMAVCIPLIYTTTRIAWALDIPLGVNLTFLHEMNREFPGIWVFGASLGLLEIAGSILTLGLIQSWGERFPRWMPALSGKRVPPLLAIIPASLVSVLVIEAGLMMWRAFLFGAFGSISQENIGTFGPALLWPLWGLALLAATLAYSYRRRGRCPSCGKG